MTWRSYGVDRYQVGETDQVIVASTYTGGPLVIACHGAGGSPQTYTPLRTRRHLELLAQTGCCVFVGSLGGINTWANDAALTATDNVITYATANWDVDPTRIALVGESMGAMLALNYFWRHLIDIKCAALLIPVVAADALHDRNAVFGALIDAAYGGAPTWEAEVPNRDPSAAANAASIATVRDRVWIWYSTDDTIVIPADVTSYRDLTGVSISPLGAVGHGGDLFYDSIQAERMAEFVWSRI